jgi:hypothetical protein
LGKDRAVGAGVLLGAPPFGFDHRLQLQLAGRLALQAEIKAELLFLGDRP